MAEEGDVISSWWPSFSSQVETKQKLHKMTFMGVRRSEQTDLYRAQRPRISPLPFLCGYFRTWKQMMKFFS